ncbi:hypothetical protein NU688_33080 [Variovorax sp. ZS18.2.2]|uniref:hypothetical protein n=1 Tax=Variovorax sp. ZS18.2.2 TaxID=2971255 RepID=UPI002151817A|nr:hypothetical protein [Variovorax sp. ZS18.2.2]MCR6481032.1 hypothetical protein [Variovorax sp. ZS18.2.2]
MTLATIPKHPSGKAKTQSMTPLSESEISALNRWWDGKASVADHACVLTLLDRLHTGSAWLACACTGNDDDPPLMAVARNSMTQGLSLRRLPDRPAHRSDCRYASEMREPLQDEGEGADDTDWGGDPDDGGGDETVAAGEPLQPNFVFAVARSARAQRQEAALERVGSDRGTTIHLLARRMFWLLHEAGTNRWPQPYTTTDQVALLELAKKIELTQGLVLWDVLYCHPWDWWENKMDTGFDKCEGQGLKPQVWWLCEIEDACQKAKWVHLVGDGRQVDIDGRLAIYGGDGSPARYPMLMCALVARLPDGAVRIMQAYAHPIQAIKWWLPVDSNLERQAVRDLLSVMNWLQDDKQVLLEMLKPLFSWNATGARPDFVVSHRQDPKPCVVIETMGREDASYRERKLRTLQRLAAHTVIEDDRVKDPTGAGKKLSSAVARWALGTSVRGSPRGRRGALSCS